MIQSLTLNEFFILAKKATRVAVFTMIAAKKLSPTIIYKLVNKWVGSEGVIFEDLNQKNTVRYSYLCFKAITSFIISQGDSKHSLYDLRDLQTQLTFSTRSDVAKLITKAIGFITYDAVHEFSDIPNRHVSDPSLPTVLFTFYSLSLTFDHKNQTILISTLVEPGKQPALAYQEAQQNLSAIISLLSDAVEDNALPEKHKTPSEIQCDISDSDFIKMVEKAKNYIFCGDAFQIVLSRSFKRNYSIAPFDIYKTLRQISPAPFMFYFPTESSVIMGASPERLVGVHDNTVTVNPIAGTCKNTIEKSKEEVCNELLGNKKEVAEHMMLVDLARNDIGAVSVPGSVLVNELLLIKHFSHVSHITSTITGQLKSEYDSLDAFVASFPAGTLSGAPKIRAMEIINELEISSRGLYGGAICRIDGIDDFDSCIAIRMAVLQDGVATVRTGAGIVYDSNPESEAQETYIKAQSMLNAIASAHGEEYVTHYR